MTRYILLLFSILFAQSNFSNPGTDPTNNQGVLVTDIDILSESGLNEINVPNGSLQLLSDVTPVYPSNDSVLWSIVSKDSLYAEVDASGLVTAKGVDNRTIKVIATAYDGSGVTRNFEVILLNQLGLTKK